jgi:hypothetical protein
VHANLEPFGRALAVVETAVTVAVMVKLFLKVLVKMASHVVVEMVVRDELSYMPLVVRNN